MFKKAITSIFCAVIMATAVNAQSQDDFNFVRIVDIRENYVTAYVDVPEARCYDVSVPIYQNVGPSNGDVLAGAIIGGLIGKEITNNDGGAILGALIGTSIASDNNRNVIVGYAARQECEVIIVRERRQVIDGYTVTYSNQRERGIVDTRNYYAIGTVVSMRELLTR
jgi:uncharacterized protein YcfJ